MLDEAARSCNLNRGPAPDLSLLALEPNQRRCGFGSIFSFKLIHFGSRMSQDPNTKAPPAGGTSASLEDLVYRSSLAEGNKGVQRANPLKTMAVTLGTYVLFGVVAVQIIKHSDAAKKAIKKTVGIDISEQKEEDAPPPPPPPPPAPAAPVAPPRPVREDAPPPPPITNQETVPEVAPKELPKVDQSLAFAGAASAAGGQGVAGAGAAGPSTGMAVAGSGSSGRIVDVDFSQVKPLFKPPAPPYPPLAKIARIQGTVVVEIIVGVDGLPVSAKALEGPPQLRDAAVSYAMKWKFEPCMVGGVAQQARFKLTMPFTLR